MSEGQAVEGFFALCGAAVAVWAARKALTTGRVRLGDQTMGINVSREAQPAVFWFLVVLYLVGATVLSAAPLVVWALSNGAD